MEFSEVIAKRISIRKYKDTPVEPEKIAQLMEWLRIAPSAANRQEWKFVAVTDPDQLAKLRVACESRGPAMTAPLIFCICATEYQEMNDSTTGAPSTAPSPPPTSTWAPLPWVSAPAG